jgi:hypothetical protein
LASTASAFDIVRVTREHTCYELAEHYLSNIDSFSKLLLTVLDCGVLATKVFIVMYIQRREWTCSELAAATASYKQKVNIALHKLGKMGFVERVSRASE